jgi:hypothetical protein
MTLEELQQGAGSEFLFHYTDEIGADFVMEGKKLSGLIEELADHRSLVVAGGSWWRAAEAGTADEQTNVRKTRQRIRRFRQAVYRAPAACGSVLLLDEQRTLSAGLGPPSSGKARECGPSLIL